MNVIDLGYDIDKLSAQQKVVVEYLSQTLGLADQLDRRKIAPDITGLKDMNEVIGKQKTILDGVSAARAKATKELDALQKMQRDEITTYEKRQAAGTGVARSLSEEKEHLRQRNAELKAGAQLHVAEANSIEEARAKIKLLTLEQSKLNLATADGKARNAEINTEIGKQTEFIRANVSAAEKQRMNIGNYAGSFKEALGTLEKELGGVREKLQSMKPQDAGFDRLAKEEKLLTTITESLNKSFSSTKQELRAFTEASKQMGSQFGMADERFQAFVAAVGERKDELDDIQATINFQASDTKYLDGVLNAVQGLAGGYAAASAGVALLGDDSEELQKQMAKMQALLTLITGLQQFLNAIQSESGAIQVGLAAKTALLNAAREVNLVLTGQAAVATQAETVALVEQTAATEASAIAAGQAAIGNEAVAITAGEAAVAVGAEAIAAEGATAATLGLATAFTATGIGAIIIALAAGVVYLVKNIYEWANADGILLDKQSKLAESVKALNEAINSEVSIIKDNRAERRKLLEDELAAAEKSGASQERLFVIKKKLADFDKVSAAQVVSHTETTAKSLREAEGFYIAAATNITSKKRQIQAANAEIVAAQLAGRSVDDEKVKYLDWLKESLEGAEKSAEAAKSLRDTRKAALDDQQNAEKAASEVQIEEQKFNADERRRIVLESVKLEADLIQTKNAIILGDERSTLEQRLVAMKSNVAQQKALAKAELTDVLTNPSSTGADRKIAQKKYNDDILKINLQSKEDDRKTNLEYHNRELAAQKAFNEIVINSEIEKNAKIAESDAFSLEERTAAHHKMVEDQKTLIDQDYQYQKATKIFYGKEIEQLDADHNAKLEQLKITSSTKLISIAQSSYNKLRKEADDYYSSIAKSNETAESAAELKEQISFSTRLDNLNKRLKGGKIGVEKYNRDIQKLQEDASLSALRIANQHIENQIKTETGFLENSVAAWTEYEEELEALSAESTPTDLQKERIDQLKATLNKELDIQNDHTAKINALKTQELKNNDAVETAKVAKVKDAKGQIKQTSIELYGALVNLSQTLVDGGYQRELDALQKTKEASDERFATEINNIQRSNLSEQDKAAQITQLQAQQKAQALQFEREQRDIKNRQAKADRAFAVANIIEQTALAVISALKLPPPFNFIEAGLIGAVGAVQLATVLAKPIPQYAEGAGVNGKPLHPGGPAIVGEGIYKELVNPKGGKPFIADHAMFLDDLPAGSSVLPLTPSLSQDDVNQIMYSAMIRKTSDLLANQDRLESKRVARQDAVSREQLELLKKIAGKDQSVRNTVNTHVNYGYMEYINKEVFGR
ncbi:MAG: hypothetical protein V4450_07465 [Bacteroidota bacterium]